MSLRRLSTLFSSLASLSFVVWVIDTLAAGVAADEAATSYNVLTLRGLAWLIAALTFALLSYVTWMAAKRKP